MPVYIGDYLADTMHLSYAEHGAYLLLIFAYWRTGAPLRDDDRFLAGICKASAKQWRDLRPVLSAFFQVEGGAWRHKRIEAELESASEGYAKRRAAAMQRWSKADALHGAKHEQPHPQSHTPSGSKKNTRAPMPENDASFEDFYTAYPRHIAKQDARRAWDKAVAKVSAETIIAAVRARNWPADKQFIPHPASWLNGERWTDERETYDGAGGVQGAKSGGATGFAALVLGQGVEPLFGRMDGTGGSEPEPGGRGEIEAEGGGKLAAAR
jgi:uncharacterized protein YdaU (DUF1376 family)